MYWLNVPCRSCPRTTNLSIWGDSYQARKWTFWIVHYSCNSNYRSHFFWQRCRKMWTFKSRRSCFGCKFCGHQNPHAQWNCWPHKRLWHFESYYWRYIEIDLYKGQSISEWIYEIYRFSQNMNKKMSRFLPSLYKAEILTIFCLYWEKRWLHKFILKLSDL